MVQFCTTQLPLDGKALVLNGDITRLTINMIISVEMSKGHAARFSQFHQLKVQVATLSWFSYCNPVK